MSIMKFKRGPSTKLNELDIDDGSLIVTTDKHQLYIDIGSNRVAVCQQEAATDEDIHTLFNSHTEPEHEE